MSGIDVAIWCVIVWLIAFHAGLMLGAILVATENISFEKIIKRGRKNDVQKMLDKVGKEIQKEDW